LRLKPDRRSNGLSVTTIQKCRKSAKSRYVETYVTLAAANGNWRNSWSFEGFQRTGQTKLRISKNKTAPIARRGIV
jgi:hypothetical protein